MTEQTLLMMLVVLVAVLAVALVVLVIRRPMVKDEGASDELASLRSQLAARNQREADLQKQLASSEDALSEARKQVTELSAALARLEERLKGGEEKLAFSEQARAQLKQEFEQLSAKIFDERSKQFRQQNQEGMDGLLKPFREQLMDFRRRVDEIHTEENKSKASLSEQLRQLQSMNQQMVEDARHLTNALKGQTKTQGNWGEMILERILEESGLTKGREYETQVSFTTDDNQRRQPDVIVHLPDGKDVIVDAKVSLVAYERYCHEEDDQEVRAQALKEHVDSLRGHIKGLSRKDYEGLKGVQTLDFVLLFIPVEAAFLTAMEKDPSLYTEAYNNHIVLVSPTTLLVTLRTINNIWRNEYQNRNALEIADRAGKIIDQVTLINESFEAVGQKLGNAQEAWETGMKRLNSGRGNLLKQAHDLQKMGARARKQLPELPDEGGASVEVDEDGSETEVDPD